jgi:hypothetical protein
MPVDLALLSKGEALVAEQIESAVGEAAGASDRGIAAFRELAADLRRDVFPPRRVDLKAAWSGSEMGPEFTVRCRPVMSAEGSPGLREFRERIQAP